MSRTLQHFEDLLNKIVARNLRNIVHGLNPFTLSVLEPRTKRLGDGG